MKKCVEKLEADVKHIPTLEESMARQKTQMEDLKSVVLLLTQKVDELLQHTPVLVASPMAASSAGISGSNPPGLETPHPLGPINQQVVHGNPPLPEPPSLYPDLCSGSN